MSKLLPVSPETCTVNGYGGRGVWAGLDMSRAELCEQSAIMIAVNWPNEAPPDHHLRVPWMHPDDRPEMADDPDAWCYYRIRTRRKKARFEKVGDMWMVRTTILTPIEQ